MRIRENWADVRSLLILNLDKSNSIGGNQDIADHFLFDTKTKPTHHSIAEGLPLAEPSLRCGCGRSKTKCRNDTSEDDYRPVCRMTCLRAAVSSLTTILR